MTVPFASPPWPTKPPWEAIRRIEAITAEIEVNRIYEGKVVRLADFGAFVNILPGKDGLVHLPDHRCPRAERGRLPENR